MIIKQYNYTETSNTNIEIFIGSISVFISKKQNQFRHIIRVDTDQICSAKHQTNIIHIVQ